jgi:hypothetical protein
MMPRSIRRVGLTISLVVACGAAGAADAHGPDPTLGGGVFAQDQALRFSWRSGAEPVAAIATAIKAAAADATDSRASRAATFAYATNGPNAIGYGAGAICGVNGLACFTRNAPDGFTMWLREQGHVFDWGTLKWCQAYTTAPNGCYDAETIALDEFGHVEGLDHHVNATDSSDYEDAVVQTFSRTKPGAGWNARAFGACDVATLQTLYDMASWTAKYSTCDLLPTTLTLTAPTTVVYAGSATIVATLKVATDPAFGRLGGNPVSGRTVTLQTRAVGATTWLAAGTMTVGTTSGTYTRTLKLTADLQIRAVFRAPADEGLGASTSSAATIDVGTCRIAPCPQSVSAPLTQVVR